MDDVQGSWSSTGNSIRIVTMNMPKLTPKDRSLLFRMIQSEETELSRNHETQYDAF